MFTIFSHSLSTATHWATRSACEDHQRQSLINRREASRDRAVHLCAPRDNCPAL